MISNKQMQNTTALRLPCPLEIIKPESQSCRDFRGLFIGHRILASGGTFKVMVISHKPLPIDTISSEGCLMRATQPLLECL